MLIKDERPRDDNNRENPVAGPEISDERRKVYLSRREKDLEDLYAALALNDYSSIGHLAHKMKGSARLFGFAHFEAWAESLETLAEEGNHERVQAAITRFDALLKEEVAKLAHA